MNAPGAAYIVARRSPRGQWRLFYRGTRNEVFPGELFASAQEARTRFSCLVPSYRCAHRYDQDDAVVDTCPTCTGRA